MLEISVAANGFRSCTASAGDMTRYDSHWFDPARATRLWVLAFVVSWPARGWAPDFSITGNVFSIHICNRGKFSNLQQNRRCCVDAPSYCRYLVSVGPGSCAWVNREAGVNPALPRSGIWKRTRHKHWIKIREAANSRRSQRLHVHESEDLPTTV